MHNALSRSAAFARRPKGLKETLLRRRMQYRICKIKRSNGNADSSRLPSMISNYGAPLYEYVKSVRGAPANCLWIASNIDRALVNLFTAEIMYHGRHGGRISWNPDFPFRNGEMRFLFFVYEKRKTAIAKSFNTSEFWIQGFDIENWHLQINRVLPSAL